jgi:ubiquinone/menaquinone biosynthesis C-methylase UbiE
MSQSQDPSCFVAVDETSDPRFFIEFLDARKTIEGEREVKELILRTLALHEGDCVLDVGCGTGDDAREIAGLVGIKGRVIGIDPSEAMIAESKRRAEGSGLPVHFQCGDVRKMDFPDASFDRVRTDRVLMFVSEIEQALSEIRRVLRPSGLLVTSELDHGLHYTDSVHHDTTAKIYAAFAEAQPQPRLGRGLARLLHQAGFQSVKSMPMVLRPPYKTFRRLFDGFLRSAIQRARLSEAEVAAWLNSLEQADADGVFQNGVVVFTIVGQKP